MPEQRINWENVATDFLRYIAEAKAEAWEEGYESGSDDTGAWEDVTDGYVDFDEYEDTPNPYREDA